MTDQPHRVTWFHPRPPDRPVENTVYERPDRPVEGCTINVTPAAERDPDLTEAERRARAMASSYASMQQPDMRRIGTDLLALLAEYDRRGIALANIGRDDESAYQLGYRHGADETGEARIDEMCAELCRALSLPEDTSWYAALAAARSSPEAPTPAGEDDAEVWIPPFDDCMDHDHEPCPHCAGRVFHHRTGRCGDCGRRPAGGAS